ncbi:coiled-coil domain-containing protein 178-like [Acanthaster planci]|uniref:Coiled-coil domain-containing protein 178-like n=1 Tax=Acanthaster planci TaxID=133434 RepID=A0A8B7ZA98_ACAPL|nr:coiled-coil domain-containing protein 178-like [Acanthaster planci]XP_022102594.1 coiled-coil domain-containing protein 178-like [Acanthaster planci]
MASSPGAFSEVSDTAQIRIRVEVGSQPQKKKNKAFLTQPRTGSKLSATTEVTGTTFSPVPSEKQTYETLSSQKEKKQFQSRRQRSVPKDEVTNDSGIDEEKTSPDTEQREEKNLRELDKLYPIPDGWPRLHDKIFKRRALFFRKPASTNVDLALEHLQKLQDRFEIWSREVELEILSRRSSTVVGSVMNSSRSSSVIEDAPSRLTADTGRKQLRFLSDSAVPGAMDYLTSTSTGCSSTVHSTHSSLPSTHTAGTPRTCELSVQGVGAITPKAEMVVTDIEDEIPHLGAEEVIDEVVVLLGRLETDRRDTQELYDKECRRVQWLQSKIDRLAARRLFELPRAVQKEHEACATDIAELKWHCSYRARQKSRVQGQVETAELMNARLMEDIAFVQKHCPLVEEKLELERDAMKRIDEAQVQTTDMLNQTYEKLKRTEDKSAEAHGKADMERAHIKRELEAVRDALREISTELDEAKALHTSYSHQCNDLRQKLRENVEERLVLLSKCESAKSAEKIQASKVKDIQEKIIEAEFEHRKKADHNFQLTSQIERTKNNQTKETDDLEGESKRKLAELREQQSLCRQMSMEIEDTEQKLKNCAKQQVADAKNVERIKREMTKVETQLAVVDEEYDKIKVINTAIRNKLIGEEDKAQMMEDTLQGTAESLKKQVKEETHARTVLQARISSDTTDLAKQQTEAKKKKAKVSKKAFELEQIVSNILADVKVLRKEHAQRQRTIAELRGSIAELKERHKEVKASQTTTIQELEPQCENLEKEILNATKRLDYMAYRTDLINKKLADMAKSQSVMHKVITTTEESIAELTEDLEEITIQLTSGQKQQDELKDSLTQVTQRMEEGSSKHLENMKARREVLEQLESDLKENLRENKELAHQYRLKQQEHLKLKEELLDGLEGRLSLEASIKDHKQLGGLQLRLHHALVQYYHIRGLFNQNELMRFEEMSAENCQRIQSLQREMDQAIDTISSFLTDQLDGTAANIVHAAATAALLKDDTALGISV